MLKLRQMVTYGVQMKEFFLSWLVRLVMPLQEIFYPALAAIVSPVQNIFFLNVHFFTCVAHQPAVVPCRWSLNMRLWVRYNLKIAR